MCHLWKAEEQWHTLNLWDQVEQHQVGVREQIHTHGLGEGRPGQCGGGGGEAGGRRKGERRGSSRGHCLSHWGVDVGGSEPSMPVSGVEEREQGWMKKTEKASWNS